MTRLDKAFLYVPHILSSFDLAGKENHLSHQRRCAEPELVSDHIKTNLFFRTTMAFSRTSASQLAKSVFQSTRQGSSVADLRKTPLYDSNVSLGGKMVEFGGWAMPVTYGGPEGGIMQTHLHTRANAGLFDVSHMVPVKIHGKDRARFMEHVVVGDIQDLESGMGQLSVIPNHQG